MNKSKFLKKSLAALLAVMLVVAMIPLSAAAADVTEVPQVRVGTVGASKATSFNNDTYTVDISTLDGIVLGWSEPEKWAVGGGKSMYVDFFKTGTTTQVASWHGSEKIQTEAIPYLPNVATSLGNNQYSIDVRVTTQYEDGTDDKVETFKLVMTLKENAAQMDPTIAATYIPGVTSSIGQDTITLSMGFGATLPSDLQGQSCTGTWAAATGDNANLKNLKHWFTPTDPDGISEMAWTYTSSATNPYSLKVVTKQHVTKTYTIVQTWEKGFTSFTVPNQIGETRITTDGKNISIDMPATTDFSSLIVPTFTLDEKQGTVKNGQVMGTGNPVGVDALTIESEKTGLEFTNPSGDGKTYTFLLHVFSKANPTSNPTVVTVTLNKQLYSTNVLRSVKFEQPAGTAFAGSVETEVAASGTTSVKVQAGTDLKTATGLTLKVIASDGATVSIPAQQDVAAAKATGAPADGLYGGDNLGTATLSNVSADNGPIVIRVAPEDGSASADYTVNLVVDQTEAQLNSFIIKNGSDVFYGQPSGDKTFVVKVPYSKGYFSGDAAEVSAAGLANYDVFATVTAGATIDLIERPGYTAGSSDSGYTQLNPSMVVSGSSFKIGRVNYVFRNGTTSWAEPGTDLELKVTPKGGSVATDGVTWKVRIEVERPSVGHAMLSSGNVVVGERNLGLVDSNNTYENVVVGKDVDVNGKQINTIKVEVPFSFETGYMAFKDWKLSENAVIARASQNNDSGTYSVFPLAKLPTDNYDNMNTGSTIRLDGSAYPDSDKITAAVQSDGRIDTTKAVRLYVINQSAWKNAPLGTASNGIDKLHSTLKVVNGVLQDNGTPVDPTNYTVYYLYCVRKAAETDSDLITIESTTDKNVTARLNPTTKHVELTVPYSYNVQSASPTTPVKLFSLNFTVSNQATMYADKYQASPATRPDATAVVVNSDKGTTATSNRTYFYVLAGKLYAFKSGSATGPVGEAMTNAVLNAGDAANKEGYFVVRSESGTKTSEYPIDFRIDLEQTEAKLLTLSSNGISGTIGELDENSKAEVNLQLPVGTQLTEQTLDLTVSKMAKVTVNGFDYSADRKFDLSKDVTIKVVSEDKSKENTYVLKTTLRQGFDDVHESDWFYSEVMEAVANGWINGRGNGIFDPYGNMTRGNFAMIIARMDKSFDKDDSANCPFPDVEGTEQQAAVKYVYEKGYMQGDPDGNFAPDRAINRQEAAKVMCIMNGIAEEGGETDYADNANIAAWAKGYVKAATTAGIFKGEGADFNPGRQLRRCEGAAVLVRSKK